MHLLTGLVLKQPGLMFRLSVLGTQGSLIELHTYNYCQVLDGYTAFDDSMKILFKIWMYFLLQEYLLLSLQYCTPSVQSSVIDLLDISKKKQ